jgi:hypothetical protein
MVDSNLRKKIVSMHGRTVISYDGTRRYKVSVDAEKKEATLEAKTRKKPSVLPFSEIETVYKNRQPDLTPTLVDIILERPQNRDSSTMCALVREINKSGGV